MIFLLLGLLLLLENTSQLCSSPRTSMTIITCFWKGWECVSLSIVHLVCTNAAGKTVEHLHNNFITEQGPLSNLSATLLEVSHPDTITRETVLQMNVLILGKASPNSYVLCMFHHFV